MKIQWRKNVLALVGMGYLLTFVVFVVLVFAEGMKVGEAYEIVAGPFMALVGGSLAIAKDLINADDDSVKSQSDKALDGDDHDQRDVNEGGHAEEQNGP